MANLLACIDQGRIPVGTKIGLENLDRFSREDPWMAGEHFLNLINRGFPLQITVPPFTCYHKEADPFLIHQALLELNRTNLESKRKAGTTNANWDRLHHLARTEGKTVTKRTPAWIRVVDGRHELIPERVSLILEMVKWCLDRMWLVPHCQEADSPRRARLGMGKALDESLHPQDPDQPGAPG